MTVAVALDLASDIRAEHEAAQSSASDAVAHAIRCGELLIEAKASHQHGEFSAWLAANVEFSSSTALRYMRVASLSDEKRHAVANLSLRKALASTLPKRIAKAEPKPASEPMKAPKKHRRQSRPTMSDAQYRAVRQQFVNSVMARCIPPVKRAAAQLLGTDELTQLREAICAVVDQYIQRADTPEKLRSAPQLIVDNNRSATK